MLPPARKSVSKQIVSHIMDGIRGGEYYVGQRLPPEPDLLQQWKISPASLRDAFKELETLGMITRKPRVGTIIQKFEPSRLFERCAGLLGHRPDLRGDVIQMRTVVERALVPLVIENAEPSDWAGMQKAVEGMSVSANMEEFNRHDLVFHTHYYLATKNALFIAMISILVDYFSSPNHLPQEQFLLDRKRYTRRHADFLKSLKSGNIAEATEYASVLPAVR